ncbi:chromosome segregation protein [Carpediemonas membranifera]|uniref:Chromosome segregation protein n=1 Tax=Carpediemonas membranifera TaxID=201153 RepID=A0A8J6E2S2_9EUKA|nr:chromosome segregation protein [Carpediemonas membranifera]|eukprot:KAG9392242.1 chromosome segregation protein [Carpediemonas membranifera]
MSDIQKLFRSFAERHQNFTVFPLENDSIAQLCGFVSMSAEELEGLFSETATEVKPIIRTLRQIYGAMKASFNGQMEYYKERVEEAEDRAHEIASDMSELEIQLMLAKEDARSLAVELDAEQAGRQLREVQTEMTGRKKWDKERESLLRQVSVLEISLDEERRKNKDMMVRLGNMVERETITRVQQQQMETERVQMKAEEIRLKRELELADQPAPTTFGIVTPRRKSIRGSPRGTHSRSSSQDLGLTLNLPLSHRSSGSFSALPAGPLAEITEEASHTHTDLTVHSESSESSSDSDSDSSSSSSSSSSSTHSAFDERALVEDDGRMFELRINLNAPDSPSAPKIETTQPGELTKRAFSDQYRSDSLMNLDAAGSTGSGISMRTQLAGFSSPVTSSRRRSNASDVSVLETIESEDEDDMTETVDTVTVDSDAALTDRQARPDTVDVRPSTRKRGGRAKTPRTARGSQKSQSELGTARSLRSTGDLVETKPKPPKLPAVAKATGLPADAAILQPILYLTKLPKTAIHDVREICGFIDGVYIKLLAEMETRVSSHSLVTTMGGICPSPDVGVPLPAVTFAEFVYALLFKNTGAKQACDKELAHLLISLSKVKTSKAVQATPCVLEQLETFTSFLTAAPGFGHLAITVQCNAIAVALFSTVGMIKDMPAAFFHQGSGALDMPVCSLNLIRARHVVDSVFIHVATAEVVMELLMPQFVDSGAGSSPMDTFIPLATVLAQIHKGVATLLAKNGANFRKKLAEATTKHHKELSRLAKAKGRKPPAKTALKGVHYTPLLLTLQSIDHRVHPLRVLDGYIRACMSAGSATVAATAVEAVLDAEPFQLFRPKIVMPWAPRPDKNTQEVFRAHFPEIAAHAQRVIDLLEQPTEQPDVTLKGTLYTELESGGKLRFAPMAPYRASVRETLQGVVAELEDSLTDPDGRRAAGLFRQLAGLVVHAWNCVSRWTDGMQSCPAEKEVIATIAMLDSISS